MVRYTASPQTSLKVFLLLRLYLNTCLNLLTGWVTPKKLCISIKGNTGKGTWPGTSISPSGDSLSARKMVWRFLVYFQIFTMIFNVSSMMTPWYPAGILANLFYSTCFSFYFSFHHSSWLHPQGSPSSQY
jgi:hypothetical protein